MDPNATNLVSQMPAALVIEASSSPGRVGERIDLVAFPFIIGRSLASLSTENEVSRRHAEISFDTQRNSYYVTDLHSTNGVSVNGQRIPADVPQEISAGVRIGLGSTLVVRFEA
jgi:pSer/pThr/pTyr-binding forkhead associated (FHA) protein